VTPSVALRGDTPPALAWQVERADRLCSALRNVRSDVWEHADYINYRNLRPKFVETFLNHLVNWDFAAKNFG
jgi:hypothetical protein